MKKLTKLLLLLPLIASSQEYFTASVIVDPRASLSQNGLFIGAEIEYTGKIYTRLGVANFAVLEDGYTEMMGGIGMNVKGIFLGKDFRNYAGIRLGVVNRKSGNGTAGVEIGTETDISDNVFIGIRGIYDHRSDSAFYNYPNEMKFTGLVRIGYKF